MQNRPFRIQVLVMAGLVGLMLLFSLPSLHAQPPDYEIETVLTRAYFPVTLVFAPDGRIFFTEKENGRVRVIDADGTLQYTPVISLPTQSLVEHGMLGLALDPDYDSNGYIWVYHIQPNNIEPPYAMIKIVRFHEANGVGSDPVTMFSLPIVTRVGHHVGGNLRFGEDGMLYVTIGDIGEAAYAQDRAAVPGRILRFAVEDDQLVPAPDNPFGADNPTFAYGLRNSFDFDFDPDTGLIFATENGPHCDDEINRIISGGNYGWRPDYPCDDQNSRYIAPIATFTPTEGLTGIMVYDGAMFPDWQGDLFYCGWKTGTLTRLELDRGRSRITRSNDLLLGNRACLTDVEVAPDGSIYFTSNDTIYRIFAPE